MKLSFLICSLAVTLCLTHHIHAQAKDKENRGEVTGLINVAQIPNVKIKNDGLTILYGGAMVAKLQEEGTFESYMQLANAGKKIQFRSCAYVGDQVGFRIRASRFGLHLKYLLKQWDANRVIMAFGGNESHAGASGLEKFETQLETYIQLIKERHSKAEFVLVSPTAAEKVSHIQGVNITQRNNDLKLYSVAMKKLASQHSIKFIDLFTPTAELFMASDHTYTVNTHNLSNKGSATVGKILATAFKDEETINSFSPDSDVFKSVQKMVQRKALEVAQSYHPANGISYYGLRKRTYEYNTEIPHHLKLANILDESIWQQAGKSNSTISFPELPIYILTKLPNKKPKNGLGIVQSSVEDLKDFKVANGFSINCFASSEDHPELINPLQMQFDGRGRLWVSCFSSYPHPVPGELSNDTILIFEDTNNDGKADKKTIFADGLDLPDGFAFYKDGIITSTARKLYYLADSDGDSKADIKEEFIRGFDNTDTHHSGYLQRSPQGDLILSEALFHRGQFETPHGVVHTKDTCIMSLDMDTRKLTIEQQSEHPNPWKVTHNQWGETIQFYGGGQIVDSQIYNMATPMGSASPAALGMPFRYGKGVSASFVESPAFPKTWQGGLLTTHLLSTNEVNFTPLRITDGAYKSAGRRTTLVKSTNKVFRPTDIVFGHDGALYISDFYYPIIGHAQHSIRHKDRDHANGRIWRVTHNDTPPLKIQNLEKKNTQELIKELQNPFLAIREAARIQLERKPTAEVNSALASAVKAHTKDDYYALELLWLMERQKNFSDTSLIKKLLTSSKEKIRESATRSLRWWADSLGSEADTIITTLATDESDRVKINLATSISHLQLRDPKFIALGAKITATPGTPLAIKKDMLTWKDRPALAAEFPILEISKDSFIKKSTWTMKNKKSGYFFFKHSKDSLLNIGHTGNPQMNLTINDTPLLIASGSPHAAESQNIFSAKKGINKVEYTITNGARNDRPFKIYIADKTGNKSPSLTLPIQEQNKEWEAAYNKVAEADWRSFAVRTFKQNCANCHNVDQRAVGPALKGLFGKKQTIISQDGTKKEIIIDDYYIRRAIIDPLAEYPEGFAPVMVKMPLNDKEVDILVRWIKELK